MTEKDSMKDVSHTNPKTGRPFGDAVAFRRGAVAADGGERGEAADNEEDSATDTETMADVSHTAPDGDSPQRTFERGTEGRADSV